jgi:truncated hemoglobin YjbI
MSTNPGGISQSNTGHMSGGMQAAIGDENQQSMQTKTTSMGKELSQEDVIGLLAEIHKALADSMLPKEVKEKITSRLDAAIDEVQQKEPDKQLAAGNLKRMAETLENTSRTLDASKGIWEKVKPILEQLLGWLNVTKGFFGF